MGEFDLRIPLIENLGDQYGYLLSSSRRWLRPTEKNTAQSIFQSSIDLDAVQIVETGLINAPTTLGNHIRIAPGYRMDDGTLIHELTHIWQYQTQGNRYISNSLVRQAVACIFQGDRNAAYEVTIVPGNSFYRYTAEQQAMIVEQYFRYPHLRNDRDYQRMIREVQSARPIVSTTYRYIESLYGIQNWRHEQMLDMIHPDRTPADRTMPFIRFEYRW